MRPFRVVFDTNAFTPENFELLAQSPLIQLRRRGQVVPVYSHVFLEETLRAYGSEVKRRQLVERWLPFIASTVDRFCEDFQTIWHRELVEGRGLRTNIFMRPRKQASVLSAFPSIALDGSWRGWPDSKNDRDTDAKKRAAQRETSKEIRKEVGDWKRGVNYNPKKHGISHLSRLVARELDSAGRSFLIANVKCKNPRAVANRWSDSKAQYPYFTTFVMNMLYIAHHAMTKPNDGIDLNAQADLDLMTHLLHADALVSNETGFMRQAFEDIWRPRRKIIFTSRQFADFTRLFTS